LAAITLSQVGQGKGRLLFVNKKKQKNFIYWAVGVVGDTDSGPAEPRVFAPLFSKSGHFLCLEDGNHARLGQWR
jgi:hypothetical protein